MPKARMGTPRFKYQAFVDEERIGNVHGVFIDDTGSPGLETRLGNLHPDRKTWTAVIVPKSDLPDIWSVFPRTLAEIEDLTGETEFHASVIYNKRDVPAEKRLATFELIAERFFRPYKLTSLVQTLDPNTAKPLQAKLSLPDQIGPFKFTKHQDLALFLLLLRSKQHLQGNYPNDSLARVFVDEGYQRNGAAISFPPFERVFSDGLICFAKSDVVLPIQLADCAAFCLNRSQLLLDRIDLSEMDKQFLRVVEPIVKSFGLPFLKASDWFDGDPTVH